MAPGAVIFQFISLYILIPVLFRVADFLTISILVLFNVQFSVVSYLIQSAVNFVDIVPVRL